MQKYVEEKACSMICVHCMSEFEFQLSECNFSISLAFEITRLTVTCYKFSASIRALDSFLCQ